MNAPKFSIIIPARNEQATLPACLASIFKAAEFATATVEVIVVLNRCTDETARVAEAAGCIVTEDNSKNLSSIRNSGARLAQGEIIVTIDADSRMSSNMLFEIEKKLSSGQFVGGGTMIRPERLSLGIFLTGLALLPIILYHGVTAGLFFCKKVDFFAIAGFDERLCSLEDIDFARRLKFYGSESGRRFCNLYKAHIVTSCRKFDRFGDWYFILRPHLFYTLLKGRNQSAANKVWYDFER